MDIAGNSAGEFLDNSGRIVAMAAAARQLAVGGGFQSQFSFLDLCYAGLDLVDTCIVQE